MVCSEGCQSTAISSDAKPMGDSRRAATPSESPSTSVPVSASQMQLPSATGEEGGRWGDSAAHSLFLDRPQRTRCQSRSQRRRTAHRAKTQPPTSCCGTGILGSSSGEGRNEVALQTIAGTIGGPARAPASAEVAMRARQLANPTAMGRGRSLVFDTPWYSAGDRLLLPRGGRSPPHPP